MRQPEWIRFPIAGIVGIVTFAVMIFFSPITGAAGIIVAFLLAAAAGGIIAFAPQLQKGRSGDRIDDSLPFFITHFGVLATSNMPRKDMLAILATNDEYPEVAGEMARILRLTKEWGLGLAEAVRAVSESTPSKVFGEFLLRLAQAIESGQSLENFLEGEQSVVMTEYASLYQASLLKVENWKEMYASTIMTVGFMAVFAVVMPLLSGGSLMVLMTGVTVLTLFLEVMLGIVLRERLPRDRLQPRRRLSTSSEQLVRMMTLVAVVAAILVAATAWVGVPPAAAYGIAMVPLAVPGLVALREEKRIRSRESDFPAFIRTVGAAAAARGGGVREVLGQVQANKLGALTDAVKGLHRRLGWRIDDYKAWKRFGEETGSRLVDSFTDMFIQGLRAGGKPEPISRIISDNMVRVLALRTNRRATAGAFRGLLLGLAGGLSLVLFMGSGIFESLYGLFSRYSDVLAQQGLLTIGEQAETSSIQLIIFTLVLVHGIASGLFYKLVEGGRIEGAAAMSALTVAVGIVVAILVMEFMPDFVSVQAPAVPDIGP